MSGEHRQEVSILILCCPLVVRCKANIHPLRTFFRFVLQSCSATLKERDWRNRLLLQFSCHKPKHQHRFPRGKQYLYMKCFSPMLKPGVEKALKTMFCKKF